MHGVRRSISFACLAFNLLTGGCRESARVREILELAPGVPREVAWHLVHDSDAELRTYAVASGALDLRNAIAAFYGIVPARPASAYEAAYRRARPYWSRTATVLADEFGLAAYARDFAHRDSLPAPERWRTRTFGSEIDSLASLSRDGPMPDTVRLAKWIAWCEAGGHWRDLMYLHGRIGSSFEAHGKVTEMLPHRAAVIALAEREGDLLTFCQVVGAVTVLDSTLSSTRVLTVLDSLLVISRQHGLVDQAARLLSFQASIAKREGRLVLERRLRMQSLEEWSGVGGSWVKARALTELTYFFAGLDCWDAVDELVQRSAAYLPRLDRVSQSRARRYYAEQLKLLRAQALLEVGSDQEAWRLLATIDRPGVRDSVPASVPRLYQELAEAAERTGRDREARSFLAEGIEFGVFRGLMPSTAPLLSHAGRLLASSGSPDSANRLLSSLDARMLALDMPAAARVEFLAARSFAEARAGDARAANASLGRALEALWSGAHASDAGAESYLALADPPGLRETLLEATRSPRASYRSELAVREWVRALGGRARGEPPAHWRWDAVALAPRLRPGEAHLVFAFVGEKLCRWFATSSGVTLDTLAGDGVAWRDRVSAAQRALHGSLGSDAARGRVQLRSLARDLLPERLRSDARLHRLYWSPAGALAAIPVEALDVGTSDRYEPLASRIEVAALRGRDPERAPGPHVAVLAAPALSDSQQRLYPQLGPLEQSASEAEDVRALWPEARVLSGHAANESAVLSSWEGSGLIHIAAHLVRLDEIPYYDFIPLAPGGPGEGDATLEVADVRQQDLSRCELVVLSTCASGVPYVGRRRVGPSMADAFLDAGARSVLRTLRPVEDQEAREFVSRFLREWKQNGHDAVAAAHATRLHLAAEQKWDSPAAWATWSVAVNVPYREVRQRVDADALAKGPHIPRIQR